jgi:hypothetical protein
MVLGSSSSNVLLCFSCMVTSTIGLRRDCYGFGSYVLKIIYYILYCVENRGLNPQKHHLCVDNTRAKTQNNSLTAQRRRN